MDLRAHSRWMVGGLAVCAFGAATDAAASNMTHPRTPVLWENTECMQTHDRSADPVYQLVYDIPNEDTEVTIDEVDDSRRHQFFALCRQENSQVHLPRWITQEDVDAAAAKNLIDPLAVGDEEIFETATYWEGCWHRINDDVDRRPITNAMASQPVPWDTTGIDEGTYVIWGYTWEPAFNIWVQRQGAIVKVHDGGDPRDIGPGAAITTPEQNIYKNDVVDLEGCVDAREGSTMTAYYATTEGASDPDWEPAWTPFAEDVAVEGDSFSIEFAPPEEVAGGAVLIHVRVTDDEDRQYEAHMRDLIHVLPGDNPESCDEGGGFIGSPGCADTEGETDPGETTGVDPGTTGGQTSNASTSNGSSASESGEENDDDASDGTGPGQDSDDGDPPKGCGCTSDPRLPLPAQLLFVGAGVALLRRRRA